MSEDIPPDPKPGNPTGAPNSSTDGSSGRPAPEIITPEIIAALRSLGFDPTNPAATKQTLEFNLAMFGGPLPPPIVLADYAKAVPGLAERLVGWVEQQRDFRQSLEIKRYERTQSRLDRGQLIAAGVAVVGLVLTTVVGIFGSPAVGIAMAIVCVGGPTAAVYLARRNVAASTAAPPSANIHTSQPRPPPP